MIGAHQARRLALKALDIERDYQEALHAPDTAANPRISLERKMGWITEEYLEVVTAINDGEPEFEVMAELLQVAALCVATIEGYIAKQDSPYFANAISQMRERNLEEKLAQR